MGQPGDAQHPAGDGLGLGNLMAIQDRARAFEMRGGLGPQCAARVGGDGQVVQSAQCRHESAQFLGGVLDRSDVGKPASAAGGCGVGHEVPSCWLHAWIKSSVLVIVANSDSMLSMIALPYSVGIPATASRGTTTR